MRICQLLTTFKASPEYQKLSPNSRRSYEYAERKLAPFLDREYETLKRPDIVRWADTQEHRGSAKLATIFLQNAIAYAYDRGLVEAKLNTSISKGKSESHARWSITDFNMVVNNSPRYIGDLCTMALYTGQRKSDLIKMRWSDYDGKTIKVVQEKTKTKLAIPIHAALQKRLSAVHVSKHHSASTKNDDCILLCSTQQPWNEESARRAVARVSDGILHRRLTLHGLRRTAASVLAELGLSPHEIASITGHRSLREVERYTSDADQHRMALKAMAAWEAAE